MSPTTWMFWILWSCTYSQNMLLWVFQILLVVEEVEYNFKLLKLICFLPIWNFPLKLTLKQPFFNCSQSTRHSMSIVWCRWNWWLVMVMMALLMNHLQTRKFMLWWESVVLMSARDDTQGWNDVFFQHKSGVHHHKLILTPFHHQQQLPLLQRLFLSSSSTNQWFFLLPAP